MLKFAVEYLRPSGIELCQVEAALLYLIKTYQLTYIDVSEGLLKFSVHFRHCSDIPNAAKALPSKETKVQDTLDNSVGANFTSGPSLTCNEPSFLTEKALK